MRVVNSDGSIASMCGNGLRTVARYLLEKHALTEAKVETMKAILDVKKQLRLVLIFQRTKSKFLQLNLTQKVYQ